MLLFPRIVGLSYKKILVPIVWTRFFSGKVTIPVEPSFKVLRHLQFTEILPFERGLEIQEKFVRANLDFKQLQGKIKNQLTKLQIEHPNGTINPDEKKLIDNILAMKPNPMVLTFQFEPTYTGGKRIKKSITKEQIETFESFQPTTQKSNKSPKFVQTERGGQITFHGPGQVVAYLVMDLKSFKDFPANKLISTIEHATINTLKDTTVDGKPLQIEAKLTDCTGVWTVNNAKIASIGVHVRRSITSHGVSINVNTDLSYMNSFDLCGIHNGKHTSIQEQRPNIPVDPSLIAINFVKQLAKLLGIETVERMQLTEADIEEQT
ncbi:octanoyltransferase, mitochondrial [Monosporozyma unispora]|nr:hypothetical protein C6P44_004071 [Kazachstania unispora]